MVMGSNRSTARAVLIGLVLVGCDRSCARTGREAPGGGGATPGGSSRGAGFDLSGTDCSDGLVRCVEGRVEASRLAHLPHPCGSLKEGKNECACPWDTVANCASGCADEGLVAIGDADAGTRQLCRVEPAAGGGIGAIARPPLPGDPGLLAPRICSDVGVACTDGMVRSCDGAGAPEQVSAFCVHGCEPGIAIDHGERMIGDGAAAILCRRAHAERR